jgi:hypothetical protein
MNLWNLLDGGSSHSGPLLGPFESMQGDTPGTNPCHRAGQLGESGASSDGKDEEWYIDIRSSKVIAPACVH